MVDCYTVLYFLQIQVRTVQRGCESLYAVYGDVERSMGLRVGYASQHRSKYFPSYISTASWPRCPMASISNNDNNKAKCENLDLLLTHLRKKMAEMTRWRANRQALLGIGTPLLDHWNHSAEFWLFFLRCKRSKVRPVEPWLVAINWLDYTCCRKIFLE